MGIADAIRDARAASDSYTARAAHAYAVRRAGLGAVASMGGGQSGSFGAPRDAAAAAAEHVGGWVYAATRPIIQRVAGQPLRVARLKGPSRPRKTAGRTWGTKAVAATGTPRCPDARRMPESFKAYAPNLDVIDTHPVIDMLARPNHFMSGWALFAVTVAALEYTGEAFWIATEGTGDDGQDEIFPVPTHWVKAVHTPTRAFDHYIVTPRDSSDEIRVPAENMVRFFYPDENDPLGAKSPLRMLRKAVSADEAIQTAQDRSFKNGIWPGLVITVGQQQDVPGVTVRPRLDRNQRNQIVNMIKDIHRGVVRFDEPIILDQLIQNVHKITNTAREMDFLASGKITKARIFQGFGTNPIVAGDIENANRSTAAVADENFCHATVNPKIDLISQVLTLFVARWADDSNLVGYLETARPRDPEMQLKETELLIKSGSLTRNEVRALYGYPPMPGAAGDTIVLMPGQAIVPADSAAHDGSATTVAGGAGGGQAA